MFVAQGLADDVWANTPEWITYLRQSLMSISAREHTEEPRPLTIQNLGSHAALADRAVWVLHLSPSLSSPNRTPESTGVAGRRGRNRVGAGGRRVMQPSGWEPTMVHPLDSNNQLEAIVWAQI